MTALSAEDTAALHAQATHATGPISVDPAVLLRLLDWAKWPGPDAPIRHELESRVSQVGDLQADLADLRTRIEKLAEDYEAVHGDEEQDSPRLERYAAAYREVIADLRAVLDPKDSGSAPAAGDKKETE